jgi:elongator complex protein 1
MDIPAADADGAPDDMLGMMDLSDSDGEEGAGDADEASPSLAPAESLLMVALSSTGQLYLNGRMLLSNCNSFALHDAYLVFTTNEHACWFIRTSAGVDAAFAQYAANGSDLQGSSARAVERGARLIAVIPRGVRVIMQMPRGNLEIIFPRPLLLVALRAALEEKAYRRAFMLARKHRLSLNLICDFDLAVFTENIGPFIRALDKAASLNLFLSDLSDEDHARHFEDIRAGAFIAAPPRTAGKRDTLCDLVRAELFKMNDPKFRLSIVHSYLCKSTPEYDLMLEYIQTIRTTSGEAADNALNHAGVVLKDPELLYNAALGTYDFDLVVMVAQVLQKDPKEYLPFLDELSEFPVQERKYRIDLHLKRFDRALRNLADAGDEHFQTCLDLLVEHSLFKDGLAIYKDKAAEQYVAVQAAAALKLCQAGKYCEAGLLYNACGKQKEALEAFLVGLEWQWAITMSNELHMDETQRHDVLLGLAHRLQGARRFQEAATIAETYLKDPELTIEVQIQGKCWLEALMMAQRTNRKDLIETHLKDGVVAEADSILDSYGDTEGAQLHSFKRHADRLALVRTEKYARSLEMLDPDFEDNPESDLYSDTSSRASTKSSRSRGSSRSRSSKGSKSSHGSKNSRMTHRSRRRNEAKKTSLREGGAFEEVALLEALRLIVARTQAMTAALPSLCSLLYFFGMPAKAAAVERLLTELQDVIWARHGDIWSTPNLLSAVIGTAAEQQQQRAVTGSPNLMANARAASFVGDDPEVDPSLRHPLENLLSTFSKVKIDEVEVDVPVPPPEKPADRAIKPWESMFMPML